MLSCVTLFTRCKICLKPLLCLRPCAVGGTGVRASIGEGSEGRLSGMYLRSVLFLYPFRNKGAKIHQLTPTIMLRLDPPKLTKSCSADPVSAKRSIAVAFAYNTGTEQMGFPILRGVITFFKCSAPVFSIVWFTRGSIDTSAARGCAAEFGCTSHAVPTERLFSRLAKYGASFGADASAVPPCTAERPIFRIGEQPPRYTVQSRICAVHLSSRLRTTTAPREPA